MWSCLVEECGCGLSGVDGCGLSGRGVGGC